MLIIENLPLNKPYIEELLHQKFSNYKRIVIKKAFSEGLSGSDVFMIRTIKSAGAELPSVVKIDRKAQIDREWQAYQEAIQRFLPRGAGVDGEPVITHDGKHGLLWYPLAGHGSYEVISLLDFLRQEDFSKIHTTLAFHLFRSLNTLWKNSKGTKGEFSFRNYYDSFLPPNFIIDAGVPPENVDVKSLHAEKGREPYELEVGDWVKIQKYVITKVNFDAKSVSLDIQEADRAFKISVQFGERVDLEQYQVSNLLEQPLFGTVAKKRDDLIRENIERAASEKFDLMVQTLFMPSGENYPNPLLRWKDILNGSFDVYVSSIHGDLNLNNALVEVDSGVVHIIDFALSRRDHILRDCFHLEMSVMVTLFVEALWQQEIAPTRVCQFYETLHQSVVNSEDALPPSGLERPFIVIKHIREAARAHLFEPENWSEYYHGLFLYFLGALKYAHLGDKSFGNLPRQVLFLGMAVLLKLLEERPLRSQQQDSLRPEQLETSNEQNFSNNSIDGNENIIGDNNRINQPQVVQELRETPARSSHKSGNVIKGDGNTIGDHNQVKRNQ